MDLVGSLIILIATIFCFLLLGGHLPRIRNGVTRRNNGPGKTVPEATGSWPIIGHLHLLAGSQLPHKLLGSMADKFGPIFTIKLGVHRVLVVNNSHLAKECLTINDKVFASRPKAMATELMGYNNAMFTLSPYMPFWRDMRKITVHELVSPRYLQMLQNIRVSEVKSSIIEIYTSWIRNKDSSEIEMVKVDMSQWFANLVLNMIMKMMVGNLYLGGEQSEDHFKKVVRELIDLFGAFAPSDAIPSLRWLDIGGYEKKMKETAKEIDVVINGWLEEHKKKINYRHEDETFMGAVLARVTEDRKDDPFGFSIETIVKATCLAIFGASTDTTTVTLTWALALLVNNPLVLKKSQQELEDHVGRERNIQESDLKNLVYLQAIIKETLRLYPPTPLSLPHESTEDCVVGGYNIPKGTRLMVNIWKIQHDPQIWTNPFEFQPERFLTTHKEIGVKGQHFELIPFGSGRRICPGISIALDMLQLTLANIIHGFDFQNPSNDQIDMTESAGLTNPKATPLELLVAPRLSPNLYA